MDIDKMMKEMLEGEVSKKAFKAGYVSGSDYVCDSLADVFRRSTFEKKEGTTPEQQAEAEASLMAFNRTIIEGIEKLKESVRTHMGEGA